MDAAVQKRNTCAGREEDATPRARASLVVVNVRVGERGSASNNENATSILPAGAPGSRGRVGVNATASHGDRAAAALAHVDTAAIIVSLIAVNVDVGECGSATLTDDSTSIESLIVENVDVGESGSATLYADSTTTSSDCRVGVHAA